MAKTSEAAADAGARGGTLLHALVRARGRTIALPAACVVQAVRAPEVLAPMPRRRGAIEGVMTLDDQPVPVVALTRWMSGSLEDAADATPHAGLVLLLAHGGMRIGVAIDAVVGAQRVAAAQVRRLFHDDDPEELFQCAARFGADPLPTPILEPARLMALAGAWAAEGEQATEVHASLDAGPPGAVPSCGPELSALQGPLCAGFRIGDAHVALPAVHVGELLHRLPLRTELLPHDGVLGLCEWRERLVPVVDLTGALRALPDARPPAWLCIVCEGERAIGLVAHEVLEISRMAPDAGTADAADDGPPPLVSQRLVRGAHTLQCLDVSALMNRYAETAISTRNAGAYRGRTLADPESPAYMVFDAGGMFAARIDGVQEVVPVPEALRERLDAGLPATLQWRELPVPVLPIADGLVALPAQAARQLVVVQHGQRRAALAITGVKAMVTRGMASRNRMRLQQRHVEVISVDLPDHHASYPVVDLHAAFATAP